MKNILFIILVSLTLFNNTYADNSIDANWMKYIDPKRKLNEINIPGTHDSGTYDIGQLMKNGVVDFVFKALTFTWITTSQIKEFAQTQDINITEQLNSGIRYLDIRLGSYNETFTGNNKLYVCHDDVPCIDLDDENYTLYLPRVLDECINFLKNHASETIIIHFTEENLISADIKKHFGDLLAHYTIKNTSIVPNTNKKYNQFFL